MSTLTERIEAVAYSKGVPPQAVTDALVAACKASITKAYGKDLDVEIGFTDGHLEAFAFKSVIPNTQSITDSARQIHLSDARKEDPEVTLEDEYGQPITTDSLERKACEPGQLERLFERYGPKKSEPQNRRESEPQNRRMSNVEPQNGNGQAASITVPIAPQDVAGGGPPIELVMRAGQLVEVPYKDTRTRAEIVADLHREVEEWKRTVIANFTARIDAHAEVLREMIKSQVR